MNQAGTAHTTDRRRKIVVGILVVALLATVWVCLPRIRPVTVGVEGSCLVTIPGSLLTAVPYSHGDALSVRIDEVVPAVDGFQYSLRYIAYRPGDHDLATHLVVADGAPRALPEIMITVLALLRPSETGELDPAPDLPVRLHSYYIMVMSILCGIWLLALAPLLLYGRTRAGHITPALPPPTIRERLSVLLSEARQHGLPAERLADLERLWLCYWSQRFGMCEQRVADVAALLRSHPFAGHATAALEHGLHGPQSSSIVEIAEVLDRCLKDACQAHDGRQGEPSP